MNPALYYASPITDAAADVPERHKVPMVAPSAPATSTSEEEIDTVIERARQRAGALGDEAVAAVIDEAIRAARAQGRS